MRGHVLKAMLVAVSLACTAVSLPGHAATIAPFTGKLAPADSTTPILTLFTPSGTVTLTLADIEKLPLVQTNLETALIAPGDYEGVMFTDILKAYHLDSQPALRVAAIDDYVVTINADDIKSTPAILATRYHGAPMTVAAKGPLVLLWPSREQSDFTTSLTGLWSWSVKEIGIKR